MARTFQATESRDLQTVLERMPDTEAYVRRTLGRVRPFIDLPPGADVLDLGAAQGAACTAYAKEGLTTYGVEPYEPAIDISRALARHTGIELNIVHGWGEALPYPDESFQFVHANSVMEHVDDPWQVFREVYRTLRPGGGFLFGTTSSMGLWQNEIAHFPLFPWYPPRAQRAIMDWAVRTRPWLVGHTSRPAIHWFRHHDVKLALTAVGYTRIIDRWTLRSASGDFHGPKKFVVDALARSAAARQGADIVIHGLEYLAVK